MTPRVPEQGPEPTPHYVNNEVELGRATDAISAVAGNAIVVFTGPPGVGKTTSAVELSARLRPSYPDGRFFAAVDEAGSESEVLRGFLRECGVPTQDIPDRLDARRALWRSVTADGAYVVLIDGAVTAAQVRTLLPGNGSSLTVVTEGRPLPMLATDTEPTFIELSPLSDEAARDLLTRLIGAERAAAEPEVVDELVALCECLPVALCVVGAMLNRSAKQGLAATARRLRDEKRRMAAFGRHRDLSVPGVFSAAYEQLEDDAKEIYRALGLRPRLREVTPAALAAALDRDRDDVAEALAELAEFRLVDEIHSGDRYVVRTMVALHAAFLDDGADREAETRRLLEFYTQHAFDADELVSPNRPWRGRLLGELSSTLLFEDRDEAVAWLRAERENLSVVAAYADEVGDFDRVLWLCAVLWPFYEQEKLLDDLVTLHDLGVRAARRTYAAGLGSLVHTQLGFGRTWLREFDAAAAAFSTAVELAEEADSDELLATAVEGRGLAEFELGDLETARTSLRRNLELARKLDDDRRIALALLHLAKVEDATRAVELLADAETRFGRSPHDDTVNLGKVATWCGRRLTELGRWDEASAELAAASEVMLDRGRRFDQALLSEAFADLHGARGDAVEAARRYQEAFAAYEDLRFRVDAQRVRARLTELGG